MTATVTRAEFLKSEERFATASAPAIEVPDVRLVTQVYPSPSGDRFAATALAPHDFDDARLLLFDTRTLARSVLGEGTRSQPHWSLEAVTRWLFAAVRFRRNLALSISRRQQSPDSLRCVVFP